MPSRVLYSDLAKYYDNIYWWKDYKMEVDFIEEALKIRRVRGKEILEVACGTGNHTRLLAQRGYKVTAVDLSEQVLSIARRKLRNKAILVKQDMRELGRLAPAKFDAVVCLFSAISYNTNSSDLLKTFTGFHDRLKPGGVAIIDTHFTNKTFRDGYRGEDIFDDGRVIGARLSTSKRRGNIGEIAFTYLIKDGRKVIVLRNDVHRLGLFDANDFRRSLLAAGFEKVDVFSDWQLKRSGERRNFADTVFVAEKGTQDLRSASHSG